MGKKKFPCPVILLFMIIISVVHSANITIGLLIPWEPTEYNLAGKTSAGAVTVAIDTIQNLNLLPGYSLNVQYRDTKCEWRTAIDDAVHLYLEDSIDVVIGPACSEALIAVAMLTSVWHVPTITWTGYDQKLSDKSTYTTLLRTFGPTEKLAAAMKTTLQQYDWKVLGVIMKDNSVCQTTIDATLRLMGEINISQRSVYSSSQSDFSEILSEIKKHARIILVCMPNSDAQELLKQADRLEMTSNEYVYLYYELPFQAGISSITSTDNSLSNALGNVLTISAIYVSNVDVQKKFENEVKEKLKRPPFSYVAADQVDKFAGYLHDAVLLYAYAANRSIADTRMLNKSLVANYSKGLSFEGITGSVNIDANGDREPIYELKHFQDGDWKAVATIQKEKYKQQVKIEWKGETQLAPPDTPECGFEGKKCQVIEIVAIVAGSISGLLLVVLLIFVIVTIRRRQTSKPKDISWIVDYNEIKFRRSRVNNVRPGTPASMHGPHPRKKLIRSSTRMTLGLGSLCSLDKTQQIFASIAHYRAKIVAVKKLKRRSIKRTKSVIRDFIALHELHHDNLNPFIGIAFDTDSSCALTLYCTKGSLQDVLENDDIKLDWMFKMSFATDLAKGLEYLHKSFIRSHGNLKSSNCVIDNRWVLKITDYGLIAEHQEKQDEIGDYEYHKSLLWLAPELLRDKNRPARGTQLGDVYSFAIIFYEIMQRISPYYYNDSSPTEVIEYIASGHDPPFRPAIIPDVDTAGKPEVLSLLRSCWAEDPNERPDAREVRRRLRGINGGKKINIVDNMVKMMEAYTNNLEDLVTERTEELELEKEKTDMLLFRMLPPSVAERLKQGEPVVPETYDAVSIFFSDIVGFTTIASRSTPLQVVDLLNDLYTCFDEIIAKHDVYKVETIGDAYMCVSGLPQRNGDRHAGEIANMALDLLSAVANFKIRHIPDQQLQLRVGLHTGSCVAGVVGVTMPRYCLFGDTVNMASRMESTGLALHIHISGNMKDSLDKLSWGFRLAVRGETEIKGKGIQTTYWLVGKNEFKKQLPKLSVGSHDSAVGSMENLGGSLSRSGSPPNSPANLSPGNLATRNSNSSLVDSVNDIDVAMITSNTNLRERNSPSAKKVETTNTDLRQLNATDITKTETNNNYANMKYSKSPQLPTKHVTKITSPKMSPKMRARMYTRRGSAQVEHRGLIHQRRASASDDLTREPTKSSLKKVSINKDHVLIRRDSKPKVDFVFPSVPEIKISPGLGDVSLVDAE